MEKEEKIQRESLFKIRSYTSCFKKGFDLYINNFKTLFKYLWISILVYAVVNAIFVLLMPSFMMDVPGNNFTLTSGIVFLSVSLIVELIVNSIIYGQLFTLFNKFKELGYIPVANIKAHKHEIIHYFFRNIKANLWILLYITVIVLIMCLFFALVFMGVGKINSILTKSFIAIIVLFALLVTLIPIIYIYVKYMMVDKIGFVKVLTSSFKTTMRHWGGIFVLLLISAIVVFITTLIVNLPEYIIVIAKNLSLNAIADGDSSGLPDSFAWLSTIVLIVCSFLSTFAAIFLNFPLLFFYGSVETEEQERNKFAQQATDNFQNMQITEE
jgi:hypothetical protein